MMRIRELITRKISRNHIHGFLNNYKSTERTLDIGGGHAPYKQYFPNTTCVDIFPREEVDVIGDAHNLPFKDGEFPNVLCTYVLNALHSPDVAVREMYRVLSPGGVVILATDFLFPLHGVPHDYYRPTAYGLRLLFENAGFEILDLHGEGTQRSIAILLQRIAMQCDFRGGAFTRGVLHILAKGINRMPNLIKQEYGNAYRTNKDVNIASAMYYLVARKKSAKDVAVAAVVPRGVRRGGDADGSP